MSGVYRSFLITGPEALVCLLLISWIHWLPYKSFTLCPETILKNPFPVAACQLYCMPAFPCHDRSLTFQSFGMSTLFCFIEFPLSLAVPCGETHTCTVWGAPGCWQWFSGRPRLEVQRVQPDFWPADSGPWGGAGCQLQLAVLTVHAVCEALP